LAFGSLAAGVGAAVYRMILTGTGMNFALVAIVIGYMIGGAVKTGSGERGGRFFQFLAVFLAYSALVGMFLPDAWAALTAPAKHRKEPRQALDKGARHQGENNDEKKVGANQPEDEASEAGEGVVPSERNPGVLFTLFVLIVFLGLACVAPIFVGVHSPISLLIFGLALWQAWRMNRAVELPVTGPYRLSA
jgi:hypothetical protein